MHTVKIYIASVCCLTRSFTNEPDARAWANSYCYRHPECVWDFE